MGERDIEQDAGSEMATLEIRKGPDAELAVGGLRYVACRREVGEIDGGISLYIWSDPTALGTTAPPVELVRMDLFRRRPHYHAPAEEQAETAIDRGERDVVAWGVEAVTRRAGELAIEAGQADIAAGLDAAALESAAGALEKMLAELRAPNEVSYFELPKSVLDGLRAEEAGA